MSPGADAGVGEVPLGSLPSVEEEGLPPQAEGGDGGQPVHGLDPARTGAQEGDGESRARQQRVVAGGARAHGVAIGPGQGGLDVGRQLRVDGPSLVDGEGEAHLGPVGALEGGGAPPARPERGQEASPPGAINAGGDGTRRVQSPAPQWHRGAGIHPRQVPMEAFIMGIMLRHFCGGCWEGCGLGPVCRNI